LCIEIITEGIEGISRSMDVLTFDTCMVSDLMQGWNKSDLDHSATDDLSSRDGLKKIRLHQSESSEYSEVRRLDDRAVKH
jgi:hypothetical protein